MKRFVITVLSTIILTTGCTTTNTINKTEYLKENHSVLNLKDNNDLNGLELIEDDLADKKIILTGSYEGLTKDDLVNIKLIKYLKDKININHYLTNLGYSTVNYINEYLDTGNEEILKKAFINLKGTKDYNQDNYNFYTNLYEFNTTLSEEEKIKVVGLGNIESLDNSYDYILDIMNKDKPPTNKIVYVLESLEILRNYQRKVSPEPKDRNEELKLYEDLKLSVEWLLKGIEEDKPTYLELFEDDYIGFEIVINNLKATCENENFDSSISSYQQIEDHKYNNFIIQDENIDNGTYFGQLGVENINKVPLDNFGNFKAIAYKLDTSEKYKGKVMSTLYSTSDAYGSPYTIPLKIAIFNTYLERIDECILIDLKNDNSPFVIDSLFPFEFEHTYDEDVPITDVIDNLVILKGVFESKEPEFN